MGLDMYLQACTTIPSSHPEYLTIRRAVEDNIDQSRKWYGKWCAEKGKSFSEAAFQQDYASKDGLTWAYFGGWKHMRDAGNPEVETHDRVVNATGIPTDEFGSGLEVAIDGAELRVKTTIVYWRKANQVHRWFVENVQGGVDDCGTYDVSPEALCDLYGKCVAVLADKDEKGAVDLLPTQSGCFFGGTDVDQWYFDGLEQTVKDLDSVKDVIGRVQGLVYMSSW